MKLRFVVSALFCLGLATNMLFVGPAHAQSEAPLNEEQGNHDETETRFKAIKVTAQKRDQAVNDIGATINVFDAGALDRFGVETPADLETLTSGLTISEALPNGVPVFTIRGVGFSDFSTAGSSTVGLYFDQVNLPYSVMGRGLLLDVERVEILKGPQGDLYGRNTTGGQINFISRKPTRGFELLSKGTIGNYGNYDLQYDIEGAISGPFPLSDNVQMRIAGKYAYSDSGWQYHWDTGDTLGKKGEGAVRSLVNIDISDNLSIMVNLHYFDSLSDNVVPVPYGESPLYERWGSLASSLGAVPPQENINKSSAKTSAWSIRPQRDNDLFGTMITMDWDMTDWLNLTSITAYNGFRRREDFDISGVSFEDGAYSDATNIGVLSQEMRVSADAGGSLNGIGGLYYSLDAIKNETLLQADQSVVSATINSRYSQTTQSVALFARGEWQFHELFRLSFGGRYTHEDRQWSGCTYENEDGGELSALWRLIDTRLSFLTNPDDLEASAPLLSEAYNAGVLANGLSAGQCGVFNDIANTDTAGEFAPYSATIRADRFMWRLTLDYTPFDNVMIYASFAEGFKSGGFNGSLVLLHSQLLPYRPETLFAYELGTKAAWLGGALQFNAAFFYYDYRDKQENTIAVTPVGNLGALTNVPRSRIMGLELDMNWFVTRSLSLGLNAIYLNTRILEYQAICQTADMANCEGGSAFPVTYTYDATGYALPNSPEFQATLTAQYVQSVPFGLNLTVGGDLAYKDDNAGSIQDFIPSYALVNARIGIAPHNDKWNVTIWGRNVFDAEYWVAASQSICCLTRTYGAPATYGVTASVNF